MNITFVLLSMLDFADCGWSYCSCLARHFSKTTMWQINVTFIMETCGFVSLL